MRKKTYSAKVDAWIGKSRQRMLAVFRSSVQQVINDAQLPAAKGGNMRVDTGFLRASGAASLTGVPSGPSRADASGSFEYDAGSVDLVILGAGLRDTIWFGWTAQYARAREKEDGFLRLAAQGWQQAVFSSVAKVKGSIK